MLFVPDIWKKQKETWRIKYKLTDDITNMTIWVKSWRCGCLVTWFGYQLIAKPGNNKTIDPNLPDPIPISEIIHWVEVHNIETFFHKIILPPHGIYWCGIHKFFILNQTLGVCLWWSWSWNPGINFFILHFPYIFNNEMTQTLEIHFGRRHNLIAWPMPWLLKWRGYETVFLECFGFYTKRVKLSLYFRTEWTHYMVY